MITRLGRSVWVGARARVSAAVALSLASMVAAFPVTAAPDQAQPLPTQAQATGAPSPKAVWRAGQAISAIQPLDQNQARGYITDVEYEENFISWQGIVSILLAAQAGGVVGPDISKPFRYIDLGTGKGHTILGLAALFPHGEFWGVDMIPAHIVQVQAKAKELGLKNVRFVQSTFADLQTKDLPKFDFVAAHGVLSWISPDVRDEMFAITQKILKPTGLLYLSYNAYPGWSQYEPMTVLLRTLADRHQGLSTDRMQLALQEAKQLSDLRALFMELNPRADAKMRKLDGYDPSYLVHEYLNAYQVPYYFYQVQALLKPLGITYVADTKVCRNWVDFVLRPELAAFCKAITDPVHQQTVRDFCMNMVFRRDVFGGAEAVSNPGKVAEGPFRFIILPGRADSGAKDIVIHDRSISFADPKFAAILKVLQDGRPHSLRDIMTSDAILSSLSVTEVLGHVCVLCEAGRVTALLSSSGFDIWTKVQKRGIGKVKTWTLSGGSLGRHLLNRALNQGIGGRLQARALGDRYGMTADEIFFLDALLKAEGRNIQGDLTWLDSLYTEKGLMVPGDDKKRAQWNAFLRNVLPALVILGIVQPDQAASPKS